MKTFKPLNITTKFFNYSLPLNLDTYRECPFNCHYCFTKNKIIGKRQQENLQPNIQLITSKFKRIYDDNNYNPENFMDMLLKNRVTLNCGTKSEPFQPQEQIQQNTKQIVDICNDYNVGIVFTTKSDTSYDVDITPNLHSFQLSVTNHFNDSFLEPNVPAFEKRVNFYRELKDKGFKVGIRFEPYIPNVTDIEKCLEYFDDVDHVHISRLRLIPQADNTELLDYIRCKQSDFVNRGLQVFRSEIWYAYVKDTLDYLNDNGYSYSTSFIHIGNADNFTVLADRTIPFDIYHLKEKYGDNWTVNDGLKEIGEYKNCICRDMFTSNRQYGMKTVEEFYKGKWNKPKCKFHPSRQFKPRNKTLFDF